MARRGGTKGIDEKGELWAQRREKDEEFCSSRRVSVRGMRQR